MKSLPIHNISLFLILALLAMNGYSQNTNIYIYPKIKRFLGAESTLDRSVFFNIHSTGNDIDQAFYEDYNVLQDGGRAFWGPGAFAVQQTGEVGVYPDAQSGDSSVRLVNNYIGTEHPYNIYQAEINPEELANWVVEYFKNFANQSQRPKFYEPMNEPFVHARDYYDEPDWDPDAEARVKLEMAQVFKQIGIKIHAAPELVNMKVIGYASAWPSFEKNNFETWETYTKMFMDEAGEHMDAFSTHLYDGVNVLGQNTKRSGSNLEAVLDLIETYSFSKWGQVKPHVISEFGGIGASNFTDINNVQSIRSQNAMLFGLMERQDVLDLAIPFTTGKSTWHLTEANNFIPYKAVLYKPIPMGVSIDQVTGWEYTDRIYFYELWKAVEGDRVLIKCNNPDIQLQAFKKENKLFIALNNLADIMQTANLLIDANLPEIDFVHVKSLIVNPDVEAVFTDEVIDTLPENYTLETNETVVLEVNYQQDFDYGINIISNKFHNVVNVSPIIANTAIDYSFNDITPANSGFAYLRMSIGRAHNKSKQPQVSLNGTLLAVPTNWKGYDQLNRDNFFGMIEIKFPIELLQTNNNLSVTFPDGGGHLSSVIIVTETYEQILTNSDFTKELNQNLIAFPNPSSGLVELPLQFEGSEVLIFDRFGKMILKTKFNGNSMHLEHLDNGLYILKVENAFAKLIIAH